ncbi:Uncharacterized protein dnm_053030 [Desulfonema magnum]|uniref:Uncharacterized protein n=1 Tax=Desulfonema magnum TaxID=45655 RepID=A0A975BQ04_9BACT|nr:Uncharacterized protein dnm_053030 [Desulfonema magnum]
MTKDPEMEGIETPKYHENYQNLLTKDPEMEGIETPISASVIINDFVLTKDPEMEGIETCSQRSEARSGSVDQRPGNGGD